MKDRKRNIYVGNVTKSLIRNNNQEATSKIIIQGKVKEIEKVNNLLEKEKNCRRLFWKMQNNNTPLSLESQLR